MLLSRASGSPSYQVLYSLRNRTDGRYPDAGLIVVKATLYGTTSEGGTNNDGTVFNISTSGTEHILHNLSGGSSDGGGPEAGLRNVNGTLYGTARWRRRAP